MRIAVLSPIAWRTPPLGYGPWEQVASNLAEGLVDRGHRVTLFATGNSQTRAELDWVAPAGYEEDPSVEPKVYECLHIARCMERAGEFDLIHNHFDFLPLTWSRMIETPMVTTIHGFSSPQILPVYRAYDQRVHYVSISDSDRDPSLTYAATVHNGIRLEDFTYRSDPGRYLLFLGRFHPEKGPHLAIRVAQQTGLPLILAGIIQDQEYFEAEIRPHLAPGRVDYVGPVEGRERDRLLGRALAVLHLVTQPERFGLVMPEAMACGTPVVGMDLGSVREVIADSVSGYVVSDLVGAVEAVSKIDRIDRAECRRQAETRFSLGVMVDRYLEVYGSVLGRP